MLRSLFSKLVLSHVAVILFTLIVLGLVVSFLAEDYYYSIEKKELAARGEEVAGIIRENMDQADAKGSVSFTVSILNRFFRGRMQFIDRRELALITQNGFPDGHPPLFISAGEASLLLRGKSVAGDTASPRSGPQVVYASVPIEINGEIVGALVLSSPVADITAAVDAVQRLIIFAALPALLLSALLGWFLSRYISEPLKIMSDAAVKIAGGSYGERLNIKAEDEIGILAKNFNHMAASLEKTIGDLRYEKNKIDNIISNMSEGVIAVDGGKRVILANRQAARALGLEEGCRFTHEGLEKAFAGTELESMFEAVLDSGEPLSGEYSPGNGRSHFLVHVSPLHDDESGGYGAVAVFQDITELRKLDQMRRDFVANVSHELRTPLTSVQGYIEAILDGTIDKKERDKYLQVIHRETLRLNRLVHNILDLALIESGRESWEINEINVEELVDNVVSEMKPVFERGGISIRKVIPGDLPAVLGNEDRIEQVLVNLLDNAAAYSPPGSEVTVEAGERGGEVIVKVTDEGPGIPEEDLEFIWERFYRVEKSRSRSLGGTGLGLAIVREIIESHGGTVGVESKPGAGSTFYFTLKTANH